MWWTYLIILITLVVLELVYFKIADSFNIIDKPNERSSHSTVVLRGGGIIFTISILAWFGWQVFQDSSFRYQEYLPFVIGLVLIAGVSFWDDVHSLPDSVRLVAQFAAMILMLYSFMSKDSGFMSWAWYWQVLIGIAALIVCVGATNVINFMDGINGITAGYALAVLVPLLMLDVKGRTEDVAGFIEPSYLIVAIIGVLVFCIFNFRPKGKAKCFAGDVGSIGIAFIMLFAIGKLILATKDITWLIFLLVYGVDGCCTIIHRIMLHENLGEAHRKHAFQIMANELKMGHVTVTLIYMVLQLIISLLMVYVVPDTLAWHWGYSIVVGILLAGMYVLFMMKYYHLHEEYLESLRSCECHLHGGLGLRGEHLHPRSIRAGA